MMNKNVDYTLSIEIRGLDINENEVSTALQLDCVEFYDESNKKMKRKKTPEDIWSHNLWVFSVEGNNLEFEKICNQFMSSLGNLHRLSNLHSRISDIRLHLFINSNLAQIHTFISRDLLKSLSELELPLDINILSFGYFEKQKR